MTNKHVSSEKDKHVAMEELLEAVFSIGPALRVYASKKCGLETMPVWRQDRIPPP
jgi:hypothetical protein